MKIFGLLIVVFLAIPILLFVLFGRDAILSIILYFQLLVLWGQLEVTLRQHSLFLLQFEPTFSVELRRFDGEDRATLLLKNTSQNMAYNIMISRMLERGEPMQPDIWEEKVSINFISSLAPNEEKPLGSVDTQLLKNGRSLEIFYHNKQGELRALRVLSYKNNFVIFPETPRPTGFLLELLSQLFTFYKLWGWKRLEREK